MRINKLTKNLIVSIVAQLLSVLTSLILGFIVPKFIDELQYAYWQTYVLYVGYVGILHFGLLDGIVLRYSQYDYDQLDKPRVRSQFQFLLIFNFVLCVGTSLISACFVGGTYWIIFLLVSIGMITKNMFTYTSYTFQITNRISKYALLVIIQRMAYAAFVVTLLLLKVNDFYWYCIADLFGDVCGIIFGMIFNRGLYFGKGLPFGECMRELWLNVSSGIMLMIANFSSSLMIGGAKMVIQWRWDELVFGKVSFAFSLTNVFLTFVTAISVVLFPSLKRMKEEELPDLYGNIRNAISPILVAALIFYFPLVKILDLWLPKYSQSLVYLGILLPIIIYSSKVSLLTNNYLKAYRKEKTMLIINVACVAVGFLMALLSAYVIGDLNILLYSVVLIIMARSIISEIVVMKVIDRRRYFDFIAEFIMTVIFIVVVRYLSFWIGFAVYAAALVVYCIIYRKSFVGMIKKVFKRRKEKQHLGGVMNNNIYQTVDDYDGGKGYSIVFIFACPGNSELKKGMPCAGVTGSNLNKLLDMLNKKNPQMFPSENRYDYRILNSSVKVHSKSLTGDTLPTKSEICDKDNLNRIFDKIKDGDIVILFGQSAQILRKELEKKFNIKVLEADHLSMANLNRNKLYVVDNNLESAEKTLERIKQACGEVFEFVDSNSNDSD